MQAQHVYWVSEGAEAAAGVWRMTYAGGERTRLAPASAQRRPVALALHRDTLYWLDT